MPLRCYRPVSSTHQNEAAYLVSCPSCGSQPGFQCASLNTGQPQRRPHSKRNPVDRDPLPDLRAWWRAMHVYEGEHAKPRPAALVVP